MKGRTFKRCGCTDQQTGKELGNACPKLRRRNGTWSADHGVWHIQIELPRRDNGTRRTMRRSGFTTLRDAETEIDTINTLLTVADPRDTTARAKIGDLIEHASRAKQPLPNPENVRTQLDAGLDLDHMPTVGQWLNRWLASRKTLRKSTVRAYSIHIRRWLTPQLGHLPLDKLNVDHVAALFDTIAERNDEIETARSSDDPQIRASVTGIRPTGPATMQRYRATLRAALNAAIRAKKISFNAASYVELPSGKRPKALLWTDERIRRWRDTGQKPSRVMVWTPDQTGQFLDHAAHDPLYPLYHLIAFRGLRRGEACGLPWSETDLTGQTITITAQITQIGWAAEYGEPKSDASGRVVSLDNDTTDVLRAHQARQNQARRARGNAWVDSGLVFPDPDGRPLHPATISTRFRELITQAGLPPVRLHDLRHGAATLTLATGADLKVVQDLLGHSSITITADTYAHVLPELARETAEAAARIVPRKRRATQEPELSPVPHTATDTPGPAVENQQVDITEARIPGTPDHLRRGLKVLCSAS
ncbi:MAG: tyrosine-type recombinase/integrase [Pseudonocardiaceae bacterium]